MSALPALIGISIHKKKYYYLIWIPSESGPLVIDYGSGEKEESVVPLKILVDKITQYAVKPKFSISLDNSYVKYNFTESYNSVIDHWNDEKNYDKVFKDCYDSYIYKASSGWFNIHILKTVKSSIIDQVKNKNYSLDNLSVGIFSALQGVESWYDIENTPNYIVLKLCKRNMLELIAIHERRLSAYIIGKKKDNSFSLIDFFGNPDCKDSIISIMQSLFSDKLDLKDNYKIFYYSIGGNKEDANSFLSFENENLLLINPFIKLKLDDNCLKKTSNLNLSAYSELGNAFGGIDV